MHNGLSPSSPGRVRNGRISALAVRIHAIIAQIAVADKESLKDSDAPGRACSTCRTISRVPAARYANNGGTQRIRNPLGLFNAPGGILFCKYFAQLDEAAIQDSYLRHPRPVIDLMGEQQPIRQGKYLNRTAVRVCDPVLPNPGSLVQAQLY